MTVFIGNGVLHCQWYRTDAEVHYSWNSKKTSITRPVEIYRMDVRLRNGNPSAILVKEANEAYYETYIGNGLNDEKAAACSRMIYRNVYPGID